MKDVVFGMNAHWSVNSLMVNGTSFNKMLPFVLLPWLPLLDTRWPMTSIKAFLPLPLEPRMAMTSPEWTSKETSLRMRPEVILPVNLDQQEAFSGGTIGPVCDTDISSNVWYASTIPDDPRASFTGGGPYIFQVQRLIQLIQSLLLKSLIWIVNIWMDDENQ